MLAKTSKFLEAIVPFISWESFKFVYHLSVIIFVKNLRFKSFILTLSFQVWWTLGNFFICFTTHKFSTAEKFWLIWCFSLKTRQGKCFSWLQKIFGSSEKKVKSNFSSKLLWPGVSSGNKALLRAGGWVIVTLASSRTGNSQAKSPSSFPLWNWSQRMPRDSIRKLNSCSQCWNQSNER